MTAEALSSGVALWRQVADGIELAIADGRYLPGGKLPGRLRSPRITG